MKITITVQEGEEVYSVEFEGTRREIFPDVAFETKWRPAFLALREENFYRDCNRETDDTQQGENPEWRVTR